MSDMNEGTANLCACLDQLTYTDYQYYDSQNNHNMMVADFLDDPHVKSADCYDELSEAMKGNPGFAGMTIVAQSHFDYPPRAYNYMGDDCTGDPIQAYAFQDNEGNLYIAYRGTGDGRWFDDGQGLYEYDTDMQRAATSFADECIANYGEGHNIYITGHSKGGNEAQYVTLTSKYADRITACYSFDGQGFSKSFYEDFKNNPYRSKLFSINGDNDPVHQLGYQLVPDSNKKYVICDVEWEKFWAHDLSCILKNGKLNLESEPGFLCEFGRYVSENLRSLPEGKMKSCINAAMSLAELFMSRGVSLDYADHDSIIVLDVLTFKESGLDLILHSLRQASIKELFDQLGMEGLLSTVIVSMGMNILTFHAIPSEALKELSKECDRIIEQAKSYLQNAKMWISNFFFNVYSFYVGVKEWFFTHSPGFSFATYNPDVVVDTDSMHFISACLSNISSRAKDLDSRMNSLYFEMGINWDTIFNIGCLLKAGIVLDYSYRLDWCAGYLDETANEFESVEGQLIH